MNKNNQFRSDDSGEEISLATSGSLTGLKIFLQYFLRPKTFVLFMVVALLLPILLIVYSIIIPVGRYQAVPWSGLQTDSLQAEVKLSREEKQPVASFIELEKEKIFLNNRLQLAKQDSIYLVLDMKDSTINLEIKGVVVRKNRIIESRMSNRFDLIDHENLIPWLKKPFTLEKALATIPKAPIVVVQAPKDTIEAALQAKKPEPPQTTAVFFTFYFDRNLVLEIDQIDPPDEEDYEQIKDYRRQRKLENHLTFWQKINLVRHADQKMKIRLVVSEDDARSIYRAVPMNTHLILRW